MDVTCVIPTIPPRGNLLARAVASVSAQTSPVRRIVVEMDSDGEGAARTRTRGLEQVTTEWTAFLDDDDEMLPVHVAALCREQERTGADLVFPWFIVEGGTDPFPMHFGRQFDVSHPHQTTITFLVRTELAIGGFVDVPGEVDADGNRAGEDFRFMCRFAEAGHRIVHLPERTWIWHHHRANLSGQSWRRHETLRVGPPRPAPEGIVGHATVR